MRLLFKLQLILHETITDIYKSNYCWDQLTSILMELCPAFNPHKYSRDVYSSLLDKKKDYLHSILIEEENISTMHLWGFELLSSIQSIIWLLQNDVVLLWFYFKFVYKRLNKMTSTYVHHIRQIEEKNKLIKLLTLRRSILPYGSTWVNPNIVAFGWTCCLHK